MSMPPSARTRSGGRAAPVRVKRRGTDAEARPLGVLAGDVPRRGSRRHEEVEHAEGSVHAQRDRAAGRLTRLIVPSGRPPRPLRRGSTQVQQGSR